MWSNGAHETRREARSREEAGYTEWSESELTGRERLSWYLPCCDERSDEFGLAELHCRELTETLY